MSIFFEDSELSVKYFALCIIDRDILCCVKIMYFGGIINKNSVSDSVCLIYSIQCR